MAQLVFIAKAKIHKRRYMADSHTTIKDVRAVYAHSIGEAIDKYEKYWHDQCEEYSVSYTVASLDVTEPVG